MRKQAEDFGETVRLQDVEELKRFLWVSLGDTTARRACRLIKGTVSRTYHFEAERSVNHEQHQVHHFAQVDHAVQVVSALHKSDSPCLARDDRDRPLRLIEVVLGETPDERAEQGGFADTGRADDTDNNGRRR